ncbi:hypothetical protein ACQPXB_21230 [Amycolatopsis sp. CA-161197]|uniref:hypothetical protein n=1 Tax=Amycolatopsis sp. CA-161197 TaxID=3239922 RepID=UPI003D8C7E88
MIERYGWDALPAAAQDAVRAHLGDVTVVRDIEQGMNCDLALVVDSDHERVFLKGVKGVSLRMRWLRNEASFGGLTAGLAPATRFSVDVEPDWFIVGSEFVAGRAADLSPGSADLDLVAATVARIGELDGRSAPALSDRWSTADWWVKLAEVEPEHLRGWNLDEMTERSEAAAGFVRGDALLHTDLHEHQFVISGSAESARVIDWGRPATGAAWVDVAFLVIRLIAAGHAPADAERWAEGARSWANATSEALSAFACYVAGLWSYRCVTDAFPGADRLSSAAKDYVAHRL